jgi:hypothetical protein
MSQASDYLEGQIRAHLLRSATWAKTTARHVSLHTANPADDASGTEVSGGSYARVQRDADDLNWSAPSLTAGLSANLASLTFPAPSANWGVVTHFGIWDAASGGNLLCYGALTVPKTVNSGDPAPFFDVGALAVTVA